MLRPAVLFGRFDKAATRRRGRPACALLFAFIQHDAATNGAMKDNRRETL